MNSRRSFNKLAIGALAGSRMLLGKTGSVVRGVQIGAQSYSFRTMPLDDAIKAMTTIGLTECELYQGHVEPAGLGRPDLRKWRETVDLGVFRAIRQKFDAAVSISTPITTASGPISAIPRTSVVSKWQRRSVSDT